MQTWTAQNVTVTADTIASPTGSITADTVVDATSGANQNHRIHNTNISATSGLVHTASFFVKNINSTWVHIRDGTNTSSCWFDLSTNTIGTNQFTSANIAVLGDGWLRLSVTWTPSTTSASVGIGFAPSNGTATYTTSTGNSFYLWGAQLEQSTTVGEYIPTTSTINSAPRFDHDPTTGESLGLLVEESRTNSITNNMMVGAVAGTPGTNPTGWFLTGSANGISPEIVGTGVEDGITYVDIRYSGTSTNSGNFSILTSTVTAITAATGQSWTGSAYVKLQAGSLSNLTNTLQSVNGRSSVGAGLESTNSIYTPTSDSLGVQRRTVSITLANASTARISHTIFNAAYASGATIDITLRIGLPQLEQGAFATSVIPTSGTAATRAADVASISGSNFSSWYRQDEGTIFCEGAVPVGVDSSRALVSIDNDSNAERIQLRHNSTTARIQLVVDNNSTQFSASLAPNSFPPGEYRKLAMAMKVNDFAGVVDDAGTVSQNSSGTMPTPTQMQIGLGPSNAQPCKPIKRLTYWPARLPNETLQTLTQ
jgi:hypothetical protein